MNWDADSGALVGCVLEFVREVNAVQRKYAALLPEARKEGRLDALLDRYRKAMEAVYSRRMAKRKWKSRAPLPARPVFDALEGLTLSVVKRRSIVTHVEMLTSEGCLDFCFTLVYGLSGDEWRICYFKQRYHRGDQVEEWEFCGL